MDTFTCGYCNSAFTALDAFLDHKEYGCNPSPATTDITTTPITHANTTSVGTLHTTNVIKSEFDGMEGFEAFQVIESVSNELSVMEASPSPAMEFLPDGKTTGDEDRSGTMVATEKKPVPEVLDSEVKENINIMQNQGDVKQATNGDTPHGVKRSVGSDEDMEMMEDDEKKENGDSKGQKQKRKECKKQARVSVNALSTLFEINKPTFKLISQSGPRHALTFVMSVEVNGQEFRGSGSSKKAAKHNASEQALGFLHNMTPSTAPGLHPVPSEGLKLQEPQLLADIVHKLVLSKFGELTNEFSSPNARPQVLAGIVMTNGEGVDQATVICVSTGNKCINAEYISDQGLALNDSHAEIVSRRCLLRYLYSQLEYYVQNQGEKSIVVPNPTGSGYKLRSRVQFHLYISTLPCGDAEVFSLHPDYEDMHPNRKARGQLRTKLESGKGTIPVKSGIALQTWDGVLQGGKLLTMSCSDKLAKWNIVGLQGSLLSHFVEPIYIDSIIIGSLYNVDHLSRAVYARVTNLEELPSMYHLNKPLLSGTSSMESPQLGKTPPFSVNWTIGDTELEFIDATTGKDESGRSSRICKKELFERFKKLYGMLSMITSITKASPKMYSEAKALARDYHDTKGKMVAAFDKAGLGAWIKKPLGQDQFE